jgi:hypothetical protein
MTVGGQHHAPAALPRYKRPGTHFTGDWLGLGAGLEEYVKSRSTAFRTPNRAAPKESPYRPAQNIV